MTLLDLLMALAVPFGLFAVLLAYERWRPARPLPRVPGWRWKGLFFFFLTNVLATLTPLLWMDLVGRHRLMNLEALGVAAGAVVALLGTQLFVYGWHRLMHSQDFLWRWFHQMHHSAERLDVYGANYFHPLDTIGFALINSAVPFLVFGVRPEAAVFAGYAGAFFAVFQHANIRTPRWLGYFVQRPEAHSVHHARGVHAFNYADLPLWDLVFGTFRNPRSFEPEAGFFDGASRRLFPLLAGRKVA